MLLNLHKKTWMDGLTLAEYSEHSRLNENIVSEMLELAKNYNKVKYCDSWKTSHISLVWYMHIGYFEYFLL